MKNIKILKYVLIGIIFISFSACVEEESPVGAGLLDNDDVNVVYFNSSVDSADITSYSFKQITMLGTSQTLLLGNYSGYQSDVLVTFNLIFDDTFTEYYNNGELNIVSAEIVLTPNYEYAADTNAAFNRAVIKGYEITEDWLPGEVSPSSVPQYDAAVDNINDFPEPDSVYRISISNSLVQQWVDWGIDTALAENNGIYLEASSKTGKIVGFQGFNVDLDTDPILKVNFTVTSAGIDTVLIFNSFSDAHILKGYPTNVDQDEVVVQSGVNMYSFLNFDLSSIPEDALVTYASLKLTRDSIKTLTGSTGSTRLTMWLPNDTEDDSLFIPEKDQEGYDLELTGNTYTGDATSIVTRWFETDEYSGFVITPADTTFGMDKTILEGASAPQGSKPVLEIHYITAD